MEAAKKNLDGAGIIGVGTLKATKWIVANGNPSGWSTSGRPALRQAQQRQRRRRIHARAGTFVSEPLNTSFAFHFNNPLQTVEAFARELLK
ncbi:MAG: hypothetical protein IPN20_04865 [Haliscomenobacter sp.]|nr:hypothetical protein [Haliscomenobacter sp.]